MDFNRKAYGKLLKWKEQTQGESAMLIEGARQMIKYLVADGGYDYIETCSLISIKQNVQDIVIPSEEESIQLNPLDYEEFLEVLGETILAKYIRECFQKKVPMGAALHRKAMNQKYWRFLTKFLRN